MVAAQDAGPAGSPELELAQRYAPIMLLKQQARECDNDGEPYLPAPVEIAFDDPAVVLRQAPTAAEIERAPAGPELFERDATHYVDLPGHPRTPGCDYERTARARMENQRPVVYAHLATEEVDGEAGLALQYWFWYYFNDFNDKHEGDWEMIQLRFAAASAEAALGGEPVDVAFSQHKGGEAVGWDAPALEKEGEHPVVYVSRGSHASFMGPGVWIGWGQGGAGLGCDDTTGPSLRIEPDVRLVPSGVIDASHPFAWATFSGRWGERDSWVYDGPRGPNLNSRWAAPISWQEDLGAGAIRLQTADVIGPAPTDLFCDLVAAGSEVFTLFKPYPWVVGGSVAALLLVAVGLFVVAVPVLRAAWSLYRAHLSLFVALGAVVVPVTLAINGVRYGIHTAPGVSPPFGWTEDSPAITAGLALALYAQRGVLLFLVGPAVIRAVAEIRAGRVPGWRAAYRVAFSRFWPVVGAIVVGQAIIGLLAVTIIGLPVAALLAVRWGFAAQAVVLGGATPRQALAISWRTVAGRWWRTLAVGLVLIVVGAGVGPVIGIALMVGVGAPPDLANGVSGVVYAVSYPFAVIGATLYFTRDFQGRAQRVLPPAAIVPRRPELTGV